MIITALPAEGPTVTFALSGLFNEDALPELERMLSRADGPVALDLSEITLVDHAAIDYLLRSRAAVVNCPIYLRAWLRRNDHTRSARQLADSETNR